MKADANLMAASIEDSLEKIRAAFSSRKLDYERSEEQKAVMNKLVSQRLKDWRRRYENNRA